MANNKKLDYEARMKIQACLHRGYGPSSIAKTIGYSVATVYRELDRGCIVKNKGAGVCPKLKKSRSAVCNTCKKKAYCSLEKRYYDWEASQSAAEEVLVASRSGTKLSAEQLERLDGFCYG